MTRDRPALTERGSAKPVWATGSPRGRELPDPPRSANAASTTREDTRGKGKGCWYFVTTHACPLCGRERVYRERRDGPKPRDWHETHEYVEMWDYCNAL